jgi:4-diphosphocytidyl-2-C-methyl-D-erythritol kinase
MQEKSYAKVNIFLKITGTKEFNNTQYHTLNSRFMLVENLYDTIEFVPAKCDSFTLEGIDGIDLKDNIIYKAYTALNRHLGDLDILEFFYNHKVVVKKNIPMGAGLGGGSSNAATFINMVKSACNLQATTAELAEIGATLGADVPFFIYGYKSANVSGFGEIIEEFKEEPLPLEILTPPIACHTGKVYKAYDEEFLQNSNPNNGVTLMLQKSADILKHFKRPQELNDLYLPALKLYPQLKAYAKEGYFFSGSGSSFFKLQDKA